MKDVYTNLLHYVDDGIARVDVVVNQLLRTYIENAPTRVVLWVNDDRRWLYSRTVAGRFVEMYDESTVKPDNETNLMARLRALHMYGGTTVVLGSDEMRLPHHGMATGVERCTVMVDPRRPRMLSPAFIAAPKDDVFVERWYNTLRDRRANMRPYRNEWQEHYELALAHPKYVDVLRGASPASSRTPDADTMRGIIERFPTNHKRFADMYARAMRFDPLFHPLFHPRCRGCDKHPLHHLIRAYLSGGEHVPCDARIPAEVKETSDYVFVLNDDNEVDPCELYAREPYGNFVLTLLDMVVSRLERGGDRGGVQYSLCVREALRRKGALECGAYTLDDGETVRVVRVAE